MTTCRRIALCGVLLAAEVSNASPTESAKEFYTAGKVAYDAGDYETALEQFEYTYLFAASPNAAFNIAATLERLGRYHEAAVAIERYLQLSPNQAESVRNRANADRKQAGETAITKPLDEAKRANAAAKYAFEHRDYDTAIVEFLRAYLLVPASPLVFNLAVSLETTGHFKQAAVVFDRFLEICPPARNDEERQILERTRARADAIRYRREVNSERAAAPRAAEPAPARPVLADDGGVNLIVHGPAYNEDKHQRCTAAVRKAGVFIDPVASITAVLTLGKENRLQIVDRDRGIVRDEPRPRWGMEQLCVEAAQTAEAELNRRH